MPYKTVEARNRIVRALAKAGRPVWLKEAANVQAVPSRSHAIRVLIRDRLICVKPGGYVLTEAGRKYHAAIEELGQ